MRYLHIHHSTSILTQTKVKPFGKEKQTNKLIAKVIINRSKVSPLSIVSLR